MAFFSSSYYRRMQQGAFRIITNNWIQVLIIGTLIFNEVLVIPLFNLDACTEKALIQNKQKNPSKNQLELELQNTLNTSISELNHSSN